MKRNLLALSVGAALSCTANANILITEITEPSSGNHKAIEIANTGSSAVSLTGYTLVSDSNGGGKWDRVIDLSAITLNPNQTYVFANSGSDQALLDLAQNQDCGNVCWFNGNDPVAIKNGDAFIDVLGSGSTKYNENTTLRRTVMTPSTVYDASKFKILNHNDWSGFGNLDPNAAPAAKPVPASTVKTIQEIQGDGWSSTIGGIGTKDDNDKTIYETTDFYKVTGIVTAVQSKDEAGVAKGFFFQAPADGNELTSDGIQVLSGDMDLAGVAKGKSVTIVARAKEDYGLTELFDVREIVVSDDAAALVDAMPITVIDSDEGNFRKTLERYEGMFVEFDKALDMRVARTYSYDYGPRRNNMVVAKGAVNLHPNQNNIPGSDKAKEQSDSNKERRVYVESFTKADPGKLPWYENFAKDDGSGKTADYIRIDDTVHGLEGVLTYSYNEYRLYVTNTATQDNFTHNLPRTDTPVLNRGDLVIATMNVLNYFNSPFGGDCNPSSAGSRDSVEDQECGNRGAPSQDEFEKQGDKIANAIVAMDADIVGLMEIENNGFGSDSAVRHLVDKINAKITDASKHYQFITPPGVDADTRIGTDAIANQVLYRASKVELDTYRLIPMPSQDAPATESSDGEESESGKNYQRDAITPTFRKLAAPGEDELITVSVNHFKSKGSACWEDIAPSHQDNNDADKQGNCENFRIAAAHYLGKELNKLSKDEAGSKLILGDLNSYASEEPMLLLTTLPEDMTVTPARNTKVTLQDGTVKVLTNSNPKPIKHSFGFVNFAKQQHPDKFSYSYNDEVGTLDYILVDPATMTKVVDATEWNINAAESNMFEYPVKDTGGADGMKKFDDAFSSSDHDPALISLQFGAPDLNKVKKGNKPATIVNPPADIPVVPSEPKTGETKEIRINLVSIDGDLYVGDKITVKFAKAANAKAKTADSTDTSTTTATVTLTDPMITQGWASVEADMPSEAGDYTMTKTLETVLGETKELSSETLTVEAPAESSSGGSLGMFSLLSLFGFGFYRRRKNA